MSGNLLPPGPGGALTPSQPSLPAAFDPAGLGEPDSGGGFSFGRLFGAMRRYRWLMLGIVLLGTLGGFFATRFIDPVYTVTSTIYIRNADAQRSAENDALVKGQNWVELLTTNMVLDSVVVAERLYLLPASVEDTLLFKNFQGRWPWFSGSYVLETDGTGRKYTLKDKSGVLLESGSVGQPIGAKRGMVWNPSAQLLGPEAEVEFDLISPRDASLALQQDLIANLAQEGNFLRVSLSGSDPARVTRTLNLLNDRFVAVVDALNKQQMSALATQLEKDLADVSTQLREADAALENFKVATITKPTEGTAVAAGIGLTQPTVMTDYFERRGQLEAIQKDRQRLATVLEKARKGEQVADELATIPSVANAPDLTRALAELGTAEQQLIALRSRYTDSMTNVQNQAAKVNELRTRIIPSYIAGLGSALRAQETALSSAIGEASRELQQIPGRTITEQKLTRDRDILAAMHGNLQMEYQRARLAEASAVPDVRVLDPAVQPQRPSSNSAVMLVLAAFAVSLGLALALALLLDRIDKRLRYPDQVSRDLGLGILGAVPALKKLPSGEQNPEDLAQVVDAFRTIRMNVAHAYGAAGPVTLTISSPGPGDGKSLVSSNLALSFAEAGYRTLLVDGDIRRGELHGMFGTDRRPGLLDHLMGQSSLDAIVRSTNHKNLTLIPCGTRHHHGPELLGSTAMRELMATLRSQYDAIIVDSPPLGAGIDPFVLGTATGNMLVVLRSGETDRRMAEEKLKNLDRLPIRLLGAVVNDVNTADVQYKNYRYVYGYTADEEPIALEAGTA